jgi:2-polyprenyl-6-methoxyphenol hydroxylase-like FAD-dependent oxidoreductase
LGAACTSFEQDSKGVQMFFADGTEEGGDLLVGADGLHSKIREGLLNDGAPRYAGYTTWRAVVTLENELVPAGEALEVWGRGSGLSAPRSVGEECTGPSAKTRLRGSTTYRLRA